MGSRGYGDFGSYKPNSDRLKCGDNLGVVNLEDVNSYGYYKCANGLPTNGESVHVEFHSHSQRIVVVSDLNNEVIGALPVKYNFLRICLDRGYSYSGIIYATSSYPVVKVEVEINAN